jgi:hypothetical protein
MSPALKALEQHRADFAYVIPAETSAPLTKFPNMPAFEFRKPSILLAGSVGLALSGFAAAEPVNFSREVLPVLSDRCFYCHGPDEKHRKADLRLDDEAAAKAAGNNGAAIVPGAPEKSLIIQRILSKDPDELMPPPEAHKDLTPSQIATLQRWIAEGAPWGKHWAFTSLERPTIKEPGNPVDVLVGATLKRDGMDFSPETDPRTLLRRASLSLTGLPPTPDGMASWLADTSPAAWEKQVDQLLASRAYGERMAWDWMEASRYADSNGYQGDNDRTMWPWRDWVVKAFNRNMPWDEFTIWQLAGDLLPNATDEQKLATAFLRNHAINGEGGRIPEENRVDYVFDMAETTGTVWLGLTFNCCRCHDHKFDPLTNRDYYSLTAFFNQTPVDGGGGDAQTPPVLRIPPANEAQLLAEVDKSLAAKRQSLDAARKDAEPRRPAWEKQILTEAEAARAAGKPETNSALVVILRIAPEQLTDEQRKSLTTAWEASEPTVAALAREVGELEKRRRDIGNEGPKVMIMADQAMPRKTFILSHGLYNKPGDEVSAALPGFLATLPPEAPRNRLGLAQWIVSRENPLTARVTVNRFWQMLFGTGLVKSSEDFGVQAEFPVQPALLDWLAAEFRDSGWNVKQLLRIILTSNTWKQSSRGTPAMLEQDPFNKLLARGPRFRMPSAMIRDQALAASGLLRPMDGGWNVNPYQPDGVWEEATFGARKYNRSTGDDLHRRSLYTFWRRIVGPTMFFDTGSRLVCSVKPLRTNTPLHALATTNDVTFVEAARALALVTADKKDAGARVNAMFERVLGRSASAEQSAVLLSGMERHRQRFSASPDRAIKFLGEGTVVPPEPERTPELAAWTMTALTILNMDETLNLE